MTGEPGRGVYGNSVFSAQLFYKSKTILILKVYFLKIQVLDVKTSYNSGIVPGKILRKYHLTKCLHTITLKADSLNQVDSLRVILNEGPMCQIIKQFIPWLSNDIYQSPH